MGYERLKRIYFGIYANARDAEIKDMPETLEADSEFHELLEQLSESLKLEIEGAHGRCTSCNEMQGFVHGFKYAVQLFNECVGDEIVLTLLKQ